MKKNLKTILIFAAFLLGALLPQAASWNFLIRYLLMIMIFNSLLQAKFSRESFAWRHLLLFAVNVAFGLAWYAAFHFTGHDTLAQAAFFTAITPTAAAAPVVTGLLGGRIDFVVNSFLLTNVGMALLFPFLIPPVIGNPAPDLFYHVIQRVATVIAAPMILAVLINHLSPRAAELARRYKSVTFYIWVVTIFLIIANASKFIRAQSSGIPVATLAAIAGISLVICFLNFSCGYFLGGRAWARECSQSLGQKNTTLTIYLALVYANPLISLAPTFYVIWHNAWNAIQLRCFNMKESAKNE